MAGLLGMIERNMHLCILSSNDRGGGDSLPFLFSTIIITTMIKLHYIKNEDASIVYDYDCYNNSFDKKNAVDWILSQGYELVGES